MATSGSTDFNQTGGEIVTRALRGLGAVSKGEAPDADEMADGMEALNAMVKQWQVEGINLWKQEDLIVWLVKGTAKYTIGSSGDHAAITWVRTTLSAAAVATDATLTVSSITGMTTGDFVGIVLDDGTLQWDTINGAPGGSTVTLTGTVTSAAASGNQVWTYTTKPSRPLRLDLPRRRDSALQDVPIWEISRQEYFDTPNKTSQSSPVNVYYDPQLSSGEIRVWPSPDTVNDTLLFTAKMQIEDFDATTNNPDLPQEWLNALAWGLADQLALSYEVSPDIHLRVMQKAEQSKSVLKAWDTEDTGIYIQPDFGS